MPLDEKELLLTIINKENDKNRPDGSNEGLLKFSIKFVIFIVLLGVLGGTFGGLGLIVWIILLGAYLIISFMRSSSKDSNRKNYKSNNQKRYRCAKCGHSFRGLVDKCPNCGIIFNLNQSESEQVHYCVNCGYEFKGKLNICPRCGRKLSY